MIIEIDGVIINGDNAGIVLVDDEEGTVELEMDLETLNRLKSSIGREQKRSRKRSKR